VADIDARELGRLRWRCRRGMRELDVLLRSYLDRQYCTASGADQEAFRRLLEVPDTQIQAYCLGRLRPAAPELAALIDRIVAGAATASCAVGPANGC